MYATSNSAGLDPTALLVSDTWTHAGVVPHVANVYASNWRTPVVAAKSGNGFKMPHVLTGASRLMRPTCVPVIAVKPVPAAGAIPLSVDEIEMVFDPVWSWNGMVVGLGPPT